MPEKKHPIIKLSASGAIKGKRCVLATASREANVYSDEMMSSSRFSNPVSSSRLKILEVEASVGGHEYSDDLV